jgi:hypothetical protein
MGSISPSGLTLRKRGVFARNRFDFAPERCAWIGHVGAFSIPQQYQVSLYNNSSPARNFWVWLVNLTWTTDGSGVDFGFKKGFGDQLREAPAALIGGTATPPGQCFTSGNQFGFTILGSFIRPGLAILPDDFRDGPLFIVPPTWSLCFAPIQGNTFSHLTILYQWGEN